MDAKNAAGVAGGPAWIAVVAVSILARLTIVPAAILAQVPTSSSTGICQVHVTGFVAPASGVARVVKPVWPPRATRRFALARAPPLVTNWVAAPCEVAALECITEPIAGGRQRQ